ncbi:hypothetical protein FRC07_008226, partial [Ceratobasidium sp. 392]
MSLIIKLATVATLIAQSAVATPSDSASHHYHHYDRAVSSQDANFQFYRPQTVYETYGVEGVNHPLTKRGAASAQDAAKSFLEAKLGMAPSALAHRTGYPGDVVSVEHFSQSINGIPVANAAAHVALKGEQVMSFGASLVEPQNIAPATPKLTKDAAIAKAETATGCKYDNWPTSLEYFATDSDHVALTYIVQVRNEQTLEWYAAFVDATSGEVINLVSLASHASYRAIPFTSHDPTDGFKDLTDPHDPIASPHGWHRYGNITTTETSGNNVHVYAEPTLNNTALQSSPTNNYSYDFDPSASPSANKNAAVVNAFYVTNMMHDLLYRYGFDESSGNFQRDNYGKGGKENDPVRVAVHYHPGWNNAQFIASSDGQPGLMFLSTWATATPDRDSAFSNDVIVHEYTHGLTKRLTGGGIWTCLSYWVSGGLSEGWSDAVSNW